MITIDGKQGEGGGQILRTSVSLSAITGQAVRIIDIRANRVKPGLRKQHMVGIKAVADACDADVDGLSEGSREVVFKPGKIRGGKFRYDIGSAGSASLVLQTVLPVLLHADVESTVKVTGGTHNPWGPPYESIQKSLLPLIGLMGFSANVELIKHGFYPAGGGELRARVSPVDANSLKPLDVVERGDIRSVTAKVLLSNLPLHIAERERDVITSETGISSDAIETYMVPDPEGPGNAVMVVVSLENYSLVFTGFGKKGKPAEDVARECCAEFRRWETSGTSLCPYLADQMLIYMSIGRGGMFNTNEVTEHLRTNAAVIKQFVDVEILTTKDGYGYIVEVQ